jgi:hypothetical protein
MIEDFARKYRLKLRANPDDGEPTINGKTGQVYTYSAEELGVSFAPGLDKNQRGQGKWCPKTWGNFRRKAVDAGMTIRQNGDSDGCLSFHPSNREQAKLALQIARARQKRLLSPEKNASLVARLAAMRDSRSQPAENSPVNV